MVMDNSIYICTEIGSVRASLDGAALEQAEVTHAELAVGHEGLAVLARHHRGVLAS